MKRYIIKVMSVIGCLLALSMASCNDDIDNPLVDKYPDTGIGNTSKNKVLWVVVDGLSGSAVRQGVNTGKAHNIRKLSENAIYSFNGLADSRSGASVGIKEGWHNLLTGTTDPTVTSTIFDRTAGSERTISFHTSADVEETEDMGIPESAVVRHSDDKTTTDAVCDMLGADESVPDITIIQHVALEKELDEIEYFDEDGIYVSDDVMKYVSSLDATLARLTTAIKNRTADKNENWLVVVTSSYGGVADGDGATIYDMKDRNTFCMVWNVGFNSVLKQRPVGSEGLDYNYHSLYFGGDKNEPTKSAVLNSPELFNFKYDSSLAAETDFGQYTVQFALYVNPETNAGTSNLSLLTKAPKRLPGTNDGWDIGLQDRHIRVRLAAKDLMSSGEIFRDGLWHVVTCVFDYTNGQFKIFIDGRLDTQIRNNHEALDYFDLSTVKFKIDDVTNPLIIGKVKNGINLKGGFTMTNLQIYDTALPNDFIKKNYKQIQLDILGEEYEYWNNLIGYWPMDREDDLGLTILKDYSRNGSVLNGENAGKSDFTIEDAVWSSGIVNSENVLPIPADSYHQQVPNNVDIPFMTFQWLGIPVNIDWNWTGVCGAWPYKNLNTK